MASKRKTNFQQDYFVKRQPPHSTKMGQSNIIVSRQDEEQLPDVFQKDSNYYRHALKLTFSFL